MDLLNIITMWSSWPLLSLLIWSPILGGIWVLCIGDEHPYTAKLMSFVVSLIPLLLSIWLYVLFDVEITGMQFIEHAPWIPSMDIYYSLGIDGIALLLILLTTFTSSLAILSAWDNVATRITQYMAAFLILEGLMIGVFAATDAILFYVFWEAMLIPMFLIIGIWGGPRRVYATIKFFLYTLLGSVFMLLALLYLYSTANSFAISDLHAVPLALWPQQLIFIAFLLAFAVKIPMWPVHTWLPDAHVEAPTGGSVILAAIMLKMGGYGFLRFSLPIAPDAALYFSDLMIVLSLIAIVYIGFVALAQSDMKKLIAYSSISHMGFVTLGLFVGFMIYEKTADADVVIMAAEGGIMQMLSHGFISAALFLCIGVLYDRMHTRDINDYGGIANVMPRFAAFMMLFAMANSGLPGTSGFVGEFLVIISSFQASIWIALLAGLTLILGAAYTLWMYKRVIFGALGNARLADLPDLNKREGFILAALAGFVLLFGVWPYPLFEIMHPAIEQLFAHIMQGKLHSL